jgi:hypothetical protein
LEKNMTALGRYFSVRGATISLVIVANVALAQILPSPERFDPRSVPVHESRVLRVSDSAQARALQMLGERDFCAATPQMIKELFADQVLDTKRMLEAQAAAAIQYAKKREEEAAIPFFHDQRGWMLAHAKAHREFAEYTRKLSSDLRAYLVKGQVYFEGTGGFSVTLEGEVLDVHHSCLGRSTPPKKAVAVLVFLERDIKAVRVSASIAE